MSEPLTIEYVRALRVVRNVENYLENAGDSELVFSHILTMLQQDGFAQRAEKPAPVRDAAESAKIVRVDDCLASVLASAECDCIPDEFQCVKHGAMDEVRALRARVAGLEHESNMLRGQLKLELDEGERLRVLARDARALLAVERERVIEECAKVCDARVEELSLGRPSPYHSQPSLEDRRDAQIDGLNDIARQLRALAQPRAERETK